MGNFVPPPTHFQPGFSTWLDPRSRESCQAPAETLAVGFTTIKHVVANKISNKIFLTRKKMPGKLVTEVT